MIGKTVDGTATAGMVVRRRQFNEHLEGQFISQIVQQPGLPVQHLFEPDKRDMLGIWIVMEMASGVNDPYPIQADWKPLC